ncbi:MAG: uL13 family ribosomal protein, partial [Pseudomonadota bacterium]
MKTFTQKPADVEKKWILIDAEGMVPGRLASFVANRLRGKHKPTFTPHVDDGDNVIIINADKVTFTDLMARCSDMMQAIVNHRCPVIAEVNGLATAAGAQLVA